MVHYAIHFFSTDFLVHRLQEDGPVLMRQNMKTKIRQLPHLNIYEQPICDLLHASVSKRVLVHNHSNANELRLFIEIKLISHTIVEH